MLLLHYFNLTYFMENSSNTFILDILRIETGIYVFDTFYITAYCILLFKASQFHFNFDLISGSQYIIHAIDNIFLIIMRTLMFNRCLNDQDLQSNSLFVFVVDVTVASFFAAMCSLPFFIIERYIATWFITDYEKNKRRWISFILVTVQLAIGVTSAILLKDESLTKYVIGVLMCFNIVALALKNYVERWNKRTHLYYKRQPGKYSLTARYQVSDNVKSLKMINTIVLFQSFMNTVLILSVLLTSFNISPEINLVSTIFLDVFIFIYSFSLPQIMTYCCEKWRKCLRKLLSNSRVAPFRNMVPLPSPIDPISTMDVHFVNLHDFWHRD